MFGTLRLFFVTSSLLLAAANAVAKESVCDLVNPFIGTAAHGHTYPGATVPFGMVQLSPDAGQTGWDWCSGYHYSDSMLVGFSHTHLSGTGCSDLGDILVTPSIGCPPPDSLLHQKFSHAQEKARPGFYEVTLLDHDIHVELTATARAGFHRYTFPPSDSACITIDLGYGQEDSPLETSLTIESPRMISGYRISAGWARKQHVYFVAEFSKAFATSRLAENGAWKANGNRVQGTDCKTALLFSTKPSEPLLVKVGISPVSVEGARRNLRAEIPGWNFSNVRADAGHVWEKELSCIDIEATSRTDAETFYTALYHTMLAPTLFSDEDGQYRGGDGQVHQAKSFANYCTFSLWDTYRAAHPLYTLIEPHRVPDMIQSMLAFYRDSGLLPVWPLCGNETWCMIGYHSVPVIADAILKGFGGFNPTEALAAMEKSAFQNQRGLEFYNLTTPRPLAQKLAELRANDVSVNRDEEFVVAPTATILKGWTKSVSGEKISYHSSYPDVNDALLCRATTGNMAVEWKTEIILQPLSANNVVFMWPAGLATGKGGHNFSLMVNDHKWFLFSSARDTSRKMFHVKHENGAELMFVPQKKDRFGDYFGNMFLRIPKTLLTPGEALMLKVVGEKGDSPDWYMTFEHGVQEDVRVEQEYALAEENGKRFQFLKIIVEHVAEKTPLTILLNGNNVLTAEARTGVTTFELPMEAVHKAALLRLEVRVGEQSVTREVTVKPVVPYNYIPADQERESVSKTLEYAYDDWCIAQTAKKLGRLDDEKLFAGRATFYRNLYDSTTGFMRGRNSDGSWVTPFDPRYGTEKQPQYTEGNAWQYSWYVPQDVPGLIALMGGKEKFAAKLDSLFEQNSDVSDLGTTADVSGLVGLYAHGNEPSHHIAYLYNDAGQPWKTQQMVRRIMRDFYTNKNDGLCGNEDCGQMSAWYVLSALGFYPPNPASGVYEIGSPLIKRATLHLENGKEFTIIAKNASDKNMYIQSATLNGQPLTVPRLQHSDIIAGGTLEFEMGASPNLTWGTRP